MPRERIALTVLIDLDPVPGAFHTKESAKEHIEALLLLSRVGHYTPIVLTNEPE